MREESTFINKIMRSSYWVIKSEIAINSLVLQLLCIPGSMRGGSDNFQLIASSVGLEFTSVCVCVCVCLCVPRYVCVVCVCVCFVTVYTSPLVIKH